MRSALVLFTASLLLAQGYVAGPQLLAFFSDFDDSSQPYALYVPKEMQSGRRYPLVVSLHGAGSNPRLNLRQVFGRGYQWNEAESEGSRYFPPLKDVPFLVASPLARGSMGYQGLAERDVYDMIADVKRRFPVDEDRIYLTGVSMGGGGALWLGLTRPDMWAGIAAVCPATPTAADALAGNALNVPVKLFQGDADPIVRPSDTRAWAKWLKAAGADVEYTEYAGVRHNAWDLAYKDGAIFSWFEKLRRNAFPQNVHFSTAEYAYTSAYWVTIDALTPGTLATVDARLLPGNSIEVKTEQVRALTISLAWHPQLARGAPLAISVDGKRFALRRSDSASFTRETGGWVNRKYRFAANEKRPGVSGPIPAVISAKHLYVYGTGGNPSPDALNARREQAKYAAAWSTARNPLLVKLRVLADEEVRESDMRTSNLVVFGTRHTNSLVARLAPSLPFELNPGAADYGMVVTVPFGERMAIVNSGLPWWTRADQARRAGLPLVPVPFRALESFGDYIVFRGGLDNVVAEGRLDVHWHIPADAAAKLRESGAVLLK